MNQHPQESALTADVAALVAGDIIGQRMHPGYVQASMLDELGAALRLESDFLGTLRSVRREGFPPRTAPSNVTQAPTAGATCVLCGGHMTGATCDDCGMEVMR